MYMQYIYSADNAQLCGIRRMCVGVNRHPPNIWHNQFDLEAGLSLDIFGPTYNLNASHKRFAKKVRIANLQRLLKTNISRISCVNRISTSHSKLSSQIVIQTEIDLN